jgi:DNA-binding NarL/FixJ family response regulator
MAKILILINEENRILRTSITEMLKGQKDMRVVDAFGAVENMAVRMEKYTVNMALLGFGQNTEKSLHNVQIIKTLFPEIAIVMMDALPKQKEVVEFVQAGVAGFIMKEATQKEFIASIRSIHNGMRILPASLIGSLFSQIVTHDQRRITAPEIDQSLRMTSREQQVISLIVEGCANKQIASRLNLSAYTVKSHVHNILNKLDLKSRVQIANRAHLLSPAG